MLILSTLDGVSMTKIEIIPLKRFGKLTVVAQTESRGPNREWLCECDCGIVKPVRADHLRQGRVVSCGEGECAARYKHGMHKTRTYTAWQSMRSRTNPNIKNQIYQKHYVNRGITCCDRWASFANFLEDMGEAPDGLELDRIDNDGNYEPDNCRWATRSEQMINSRSGAPRLHDTDLPRNIKRVKSGYHWEYSEWDDRRKRVRIRGPIVETVAEAVDGLKEARR